MSQGWKGTGCRDPGLARACGEEGTDYFQESRGNSKQELGREDIDISSICPFSRAKSKHTRDMVQESDTQDS